MKRAVSHAMRVDTVHVQLAEKDFWATVRKHLGPHGHLVRIEDLLAEGVPDVNYCINGAEGWLELKWVEKWPVRETTPLRIPHYTKAQRLWHYMRGSAGGRMFIMVKVDNEYFVFHWQWAYKNLGLTTRTEMETFALVHSVFKFPTELVIDCLTG